MPIIDEDFKEEIKETKDETKCKECNKTINENSVLLLCENCFNQNIVKVLDQIRINVIKINDDLKKVNTNINKIKEDLINENLHVVISNKLETDLLNLKAIKEKLLIDLNLNKEAFKLNQVHANKIRKVQNWSQFEELKLE